MLNLDAGIHFDKEEIAGFLVVKVFQRSGAAITDALGETDRRRAQRLAGIIIDRRRRRLLPDFLTPALQRAFAFETVHDAFAIAEHLHFEMAGAVQKPLEIKRAAAECRFRLRLRSMKLVFESRLIGRRRECRGRLRRRSL